MVQIGTEKLPHPKPPGLFSGVPGRTKPDKMMTKPDIARTLADKSRTKILSPHAQMSENVRFCPIFSAFPPPQLRIGVTVQSGRGKLVSANGFGQLPTQWFLVSGQLRVFWLLVTGPWSLPGGGFIPQRNPTPIFRHRPLPSTLNCYPASCRFPPLRARLPTKVLGTIGSTSGNRPHS